MEGTHQGMNRGLLITLLVLFNFKFVLTLSCKFALVFFLKLEALVLDMQGFGLQHTY